MILNEATEGTTVVWYQKEWKEYKKKSFRYRIRKYKYIWLSISTILVLFIMINLCM